jgi:hypothetical protein
VWAKNQLISLVIARFLAYQEHVPPVSSKVSSARGRLQLGLLSDLPLIVPILPQSASLWAGVSPRLRVPKLAPVGPGDRLLRTHLRTRSVLVNASFA